ncbi:MAG: hypothetical protein R2701_01445 [Acidimicrobiales bacterium]
MTDTTPSPASDEDLSAAIDGELDDGRARDLLTDPANAARLEQLNRAVRAVAAPVDPLDNTAVDRLIADAIAEPAAPAAPRRAVRGPAPWLVAAAIAVLLAVGLTLVWTGRNGESNDQASTVSTDLDASAANEERAGADASAESSDDAAAAGEVAPDSGHAGSATTDGTSPATTITPTLPSAVDLGTFADGDALRTALATSFPDVAVTSTSDGPSTASVERCATQLEITLGLDDGPTQIGWATIGGQEALVYEFSTSSYEDGTPTTLVTAVGAEACNQIVFFER